MSHYPDDPQCGRSLWQRVRDRLFWRDDALSDVQANTFAIRAGLVDVVRKIDDLTRKVITMGAQTAAALAELKDDLTKVRDGWAALIAERDQYKAALESADADKAQAVADALAADDAVDTAAIAEAGALVHDLVNQAEQPPVDNGGGEVPPGDGGGEVVPPADGGGDVPVDPNVGNQ